MLIYPALEAALLCTDPMEKCRHTQILQDTCVRLPALNRHEDSAPSDFRFAGRPPRPQLVSPSAVKPRKITTTEGYAALLHAVCHIEFNAINLALDAAYRFRRLPENYVRDWIRVAAEEARHFQLIRARLQYWGFDYGDFPAHNHLWDMAYKTAFDPLLRMALVPRVLEARGLDVTPGIRRKIAQKGDAETCAALDVIYREEVGHVAIGNYWYQYLCARRSHDPVTLFRALLQRYDLFVFRGHVNLSAREQAGFSAFELAMLENFEQSRQTHHQRS